MVLGFMATSSEIGELQAIFDEYCRQHGVIEPDRRDAYAHRLVEAYATGLRGNEGLIACLDRARLG